ncbi:hypothetical protein HK405_005194 [Cladochytrium tenue]|nr:hypothetical protein HK405_005194 [Cladochytrium tenue]
MQVEQAGLDGEVGRVLAVFEQRETEDTWMQMDDTLARLAAVTRGSAQLPGFVASLRRLKLVVPQALSTERTRLARTAMTLVEVLALSLGDRFEPLVDFSVPALLRLCTRANKVFVSCASATLRTVIEHAGVPSCVPLLAEALQSNSKSLRASAADCLNAALEANSPAKLDVYGEAVETALRLAIVDAAPEVRTLARTSYDLFRAKFPGRLDRFLYGLPDVALKYLKVARPAPPPVLRKMTSPKTKPSQTRTTSVEVEEWQNENDFASESFGPDGERQKHHSIADSGVSLGSDVSAGSYPNNRKPQSTVSSTASSSRSGPGVGTPRRAMTETQRFHGADVSALHSFSTTDAPVVRSTSAPQRQRGIRSTPSSKEPLLARYSSLPRVDDSTDAVSLASSSSSKSTPKPRRPYSLNAATTPPRSVSRVSNRPSSMLVEVGSHSATSVNIADIASKLKSSDWSVRLRNLEALNSFVTASALPLANPTIVAEVRSRLPRIYDVYLTGLADNHSKCLGAAMVGLAALVEGHGCDDAIMDSLIPKLVGSFLLPSSAKVKPGLVVLGRKLLIVLKARKGTAPCAMSAAHALNNPEYSKSLRTRVGCLGLLAELSDEEWSQLAKEKTSLLKGIIARLLAVAGDADPAVQKLLKPLFANISALAAEVFWGMWTNAKPPERKNVNSLFGVRDISLDRKELEAARKPIHADVVSLNGIAPTRAAPKARESPRQAAGLVVSEVAVDDIDRLTTRSMSSNSTASRVRSKAGPSQAKLEDEAAEAEATSRGGRRRWKAPASSSDEDSDDDGSSNGNASRLGIAYEDSDTDWMTDNEVFMDEDDDSDSSEGESAARSLTGRLPVRIKASKNNLAVGKSEISTSAAVAKANGSRQTLRSILSKDVMKAADQAPALPPDAPLEVRVEKTLTQNTDYLKSVDELLMSLEQTERANQRVAQERLVESLSRSAPKSNRSGIPVTSPVPPGQSIPTPRPVSAASHRFNRSSPSPNSDSMRVSRTSSLPGPSFSNTTTSPPHAPGVLRQGSAPLVVHDKPAPAAAARGPWTAVDSADGSPYASAPSPMIRALRPRSGGLLATTPSTPSSLKNMVVVPDSPLPLSPSPSTDSPFFPRKDSVVSSTSSSSSSSVAGEEMSAEEFDSALVEAVGNGIESLWALSQRKRLGQAWERRAGDVLAAVVTQLTEKDDLPAASVRNGLVLLKGVLHSKPSEAAEGATQPSAILLAVLRCEGRARPGGGVSADEQLEIDFEVDAVLKQLARALPAARLAVCAAEVLDAPAQAAVDPRVCFELIGGAVGDVEAGGLPPLEADVGGGDEGVVADGSGWNWERVLGHVAQGLDARSGATRKAAFDCALALCARHGAALSGRLFGEVGRRSGRSRELVIKGMMERRLR